MPINPLAPSSSSTQVRPAGPTKHRDGTSRDAEGFAASVPADTVGAVDERGRGSPRKRRRRPGAGARQQYEVSDRAGGRDETVDDTEPGRNLDITV